MRILTIAIPHHPESLAGSCRLRSPGNSVEVQPWRTRVWGSFSSRAEKNGIYFTRKIPLSRKAPGMYGGGMQRRGRAWESWSGICTGWTISMVTPEATCRRDVTCYCDRAAGVTVPSISSAMYARVRVKCVHARVIPPSWDSVYGGGKKKYELNMTIAAAQRLAETSLSPKLKPRPVFPARTFSPVRDVTPYTSKYI